MSTIGHDKMDPFLEKYDNVRHVASAIVWNGSSYVSKPGTVLYGVNETNDLVVHYYKTNTTVKHHSAWRPKTLS